jgi:enoyl-CoA hydratase/carnithine racemase
LAAFSRGAKIELLLTADEEECRSFINKAQKLILKIHRYPKPVIALIDGFALGGGFELVLGCDYRISSNRDTVAFGFPEASLGVVPAMGGTLNLRRLISPLDAEDILLHGRADLSVREAKTLGIIDRVSPPENLLEEAWALAVHRSLIRTSLIDKTRPVMTPEQIREDITKFLMDNPIDVVPGVEIAPVAKELLRLLLKKTSPDRFLEGLLYEREVFCYLSCTKDCREGITAMTEGRKPVFKGV